MFDMAKVLSLTRRQTVRSCKNKTLIKTLLIKECMLVYICYLCMYASYKKKLTPSFYRSILYLNATTYKSNRTDG